MKKILLLGGSAQQIVAINTAKQLGFFTVLCDYLPDNPGQYYADKFYQISTTDKEAVLEIAQFECVSGVLAYASDPAAPTAAYVSELMGLPTNSYKSVNTLCNKDLFRKFLYNHGFNTPRSKGFSSKDEALKAINSFSLPVIIKPVDSSGSKGAIVLNEWNEIDSAIDYAFSYSRGHCIIIEEFIEKKHPYLVGGDIFVFDGKIVQWGLMNCHRDSTVNPLVPVGKSYPPLLEDTDLQAIQDTLQRLVTELKIQFGPMNVELIIDKNNRVFPIDIGPRSGGNMIPDLLSMIFDCDIVEMCVRAAMGESIVMDSKDGYPFYATANLHSNRAGVFVRVDFSSAIEPFIIRRSIYKKPGDTVKYFSDASDALGIVFFRFPDQVTMIKMEESMNDHIKIVLQGDNK